MAPRQRTASKEKPEQQAEQQQQSDDETPAPTPQELEKLRWRQYRIIASILITLAAVFASRFNYISPQYGLGIIIMLYVTQRFTL
jgi:fatty acid desaturase